MIFAKRENYLAMATALITIIRSRKCILLVQHMSELPNHSNSAVFLVTLESLATFELPRNEFCSCLAPSRVVTIKCAGHEPCNLYTSVRYYWLGLVECFQAYQQSPQTCSLKNIGRQKRREIERKKRNNSSDVNDEAFPPENSHHLHQQ